MNVLLVLESNLLSQLVIVDSEVVEYHIKVIF